MSDQIRGQIKGWKWHPMIQNLLTDTSLENPCRLCYIHKSVCFNMGTVTIDLGQAYLAVISLHQVLCNKDPLSFLWHYSEHKFQLINSQYRSPTKWFVWACLPFWNIYEMMGNNKSSFLPCKYCLYHVLLLNFIWVTSPLCTFVKQVI